MVFPKKELWPLKANLVPWLELAYVQVTRTSSKNRTWTRILKPNSRPEKNKLPKNGPQGLIIFPFFSSHMKDIEMIDFLIKVGVQGLVSLQIKFEKCNTSFYFKYGEDGIKMMIANLQSSLAWNISVCLSTFMLPHFQFQHVFMKQ